MKLKEYENFKITDLGEVEETVYDIEVDNDHNFFANNILVHNSGYFSLSSFVGTLGDMHRNEIVDLCDRFAEEIISPKIKERCHELSDYLNSYEQRMFWDREVVSDRAVWVGKKKYIMSVLDDEGTRYHDKPKLKIMGMESKKSSTPEWSRGFLEEVYEIALTQSEDVLHKRLEQIRGEFDKLDTNQIAVPRGVNNIDKYYDPDVLCKSGTPKHVRGVLVHNKMVEDLGLRKVAKITDGSKIKFIELKEPNPTGHNVVAFDTYMPKEFKLDKYVDRDIIFEKSFMSPLRIFLNAIGWKEEEQVDLFSF